MKKLILLVLMVVPMLVFGQANGQPQSVIIHNYLTYADSDADTSGISFIGSYHGASFNIEYSDSISVIVKFDYRLPGATAWTAVSAAVGDTLLDTTYTRSASSKGYYSIVLRSTTVDRIPYLEAQVRCRMAFVSSKNGTTSNRYTTRLKYRP